jgi:hypothetical protein
MVAPRFSHAADEPPKGHKKDQQNVASPAPDLNRYNNK